MKITIFLDQHKIIASQLWTSKRLYLSSLLGNFFLFSTHEEKWLVIYSHNYCSQLQCFIGLVLKLHLLVITSKDTSILGRSETARQTGEDNNSLNAWVLGLGRKPPIHLNTSGKIPTHRNNKQNVCTVFLCNWRTVRRHKCSECGIPVPWVGWGISGGIPLLHGSRRRYAIEKINNFFWRRIQVCHTYLSVWPEVWV